MKCNHGSLKTRHLCTEVVAWYIAWMERSKGFYIYYLCKEHSDPLGDAYAFFTESTKCMAITPISNIYDYSTVDILEEIDK